MVMGLHQRLSLVWITTFSQNSQNSPFEENSFPRLPLRAIAAHVFVPPIWRVSIGRKGCSGFCAELVYLFCSFEANLLLFTFLMELRAVVIRPPATTQIINGFVRAGLPYVSSYQKKFAVSSLRSSRVD